MRYRIGIDVGGTFTDFVLAGEAGDQRIAKVLSTPEDPSIAVLQGLSELGTGEGTSLAAFLGDTGLIVHGTTVTTNAILTGRWARTGLLTTSGFRDALAMRRGIREAQYDNKYTAPEPIVPRDLRLPVRERIDSEGRVVERLAREDVEAAARAFEAAKVEAVAICFLHAHANDAHERAAADLLEALLPGVHVSVSSRVLPQIRFYERTSTTVLDAAVAPLLERYLGRLVERLDQAGFKGALLVMQSNGGVMAARAAAARAAATLLSGPAAGPIAGLALMAPHGGDSCIAIDMGGTSFEASLSRGGAPAIAAATQVNRMALGLPAMDIKTIGAGGGSIGRVDRGGLLRMGPESAGARPGPACYGLGGAEPTCTDANLLLGFLSAEGFAGGRMTLDLAAARDAVGERIAAPLGLGPIEAAAGMVRVMNVNMAAAIRAITIERGHDPRDFPLISAGGAAGLHAAMIARELGISRVLMPRSASVFCAWGMLQTDLKHDLVRSLAIPMTQEAFDRARVPALVEAMEKEGRAMLAEDGVAPSTQRFRHALDLRYRGQYHEVRVDDVPAPMLAKPDIEGMTGMFHRAHDRLYGYSLGDGQTPVELVNLRLTAIGLTDKPALREEGRAGRDPGTARRGARAVHLGDGFAEIPVYDGDALRHGNCWEGPALVETAITTLLVPPGFSAAVDKLGTVVLSDREVGE